MPSKESDSLFSFHSSNSCTTLLGKLAFQMRQDVHMTQEKPSSEEIRREAKLLRLTAIKLMEHAAGLIEKSVL
jgi:hypothetical protein